MYIFIFGDQKKVNISEEQRKTFVFIRTLSRCVLELKQEMDLYLAGSREVCLIGGEESL